MKKGLKFEETDRAFFDHHQLAIPPTDASRFAILHFVNDAKPSRINPRVHMRGTTIKQRATMMREFQALYCQKRVKYGGCTGVVQYIIPRTLSQKGELLLHASVVFDEECEGMRKKTVCAEFMEIL